MIKRFLKWLKEPIGAPREYLPHEPMYWFKKWALATNEAEAAQYWEKCQSLVKPTESSDL